MTENKPLLRGVDNKLVVFLRKLANSLEQKKINPEQTQRIGEFFMSYNFLDQIDKHSTNKLDKEDKNEEDISSDDFMKFISLGWYVYCVILKNKNL